MHIPSFAQPHWQAYQTTGKLSGASDRLELNREAAQEALTSLTDQFRHWQSLDETEADLMKGGSRGRCALSAAICPPIISKPSLTGDTQQGKITVLNHSPNSHSGFVTLSDSRFSPQSAENFTVEGSLAGDTVLGPELTHIDREMSSHGPDKARAGYLLSRA